MAITVNAVNAGPTPAIGTTGTIASATVPSLTNGILLVAVGIMSGAGAVSSSSVVIDPTGANVSLANKIRVQHPSGSFGTVEWWWVVAPPAITSKNIVATFSGNVVYALGYITLEGVDQVTPFNASSGQSAQGTGTLASLGITTAAGEMALNVTMFEDFHNLTKGASQTVIALRNNASGSFSLDATYLAASGSTTTMTDTDGTSSAWLMAGVSLTADGGGSGGRTLFLPSGLDGLSTSGSKQFNPRLG